MKKAFVLSMGALLVAASIAMADMVKCKKLDGSLYIGPAPPAGCVDTGTRYDGAPAGVSAGQSWTEETSPDKGRQGMSYCTCAQLQCSQELTISACTISCQQPSIAKCACLARSDCASSYPSPQKCFCK